MLASKQVPAVEAMTLVLKSNVGALNSRPSLVTLSRRPPYAFCLVGSVIASSDVYENLLQIFSTKVLN